MEIYTMKKKYILLSVCFIFNSFISQSFKNEIKKRKCKIDTCFINKLQFSDGIQQIVTFSIAHNVSDVSAQQIDEYMMQREGVVSSKSNPIAKTTTLILKEGVDTELISQLLKYAEHLFIKQNCNIESH